MFRIGKIHTISRRAVTALITAVLLVTASGLLVVGLSVASLNRAAPAFRILDEPLAGSVTGAGWDLPSIPTANLLQDPSFEPYVVRKRMEILDSSGRILYVPAGEAESDLYGDGFFTGADVRIVSPSMQGMELRHSSRVSAYRIRRIGTFRTLATPAGAGAVPFLSDFAFSGGTLIAAGAEGTLLLGADDTLSAPVRTGATGTLTGVEADSEGRLYVCSDSGSLRDSANMSSWNAWSVPGTPVFRALALSDGLVVAVGDAGVVCAGRDGSVGRISVPSDADFNDVAGSGGAFVACGTNSTILMSANGLVWNVVEPEAGAIWRAVDAVGTRFVLVGTGGQVCVIGADRSLRQYTVGGMPDLVDVACLSEDLVAALDANGRIYLSQDGGAAWQPCGMEVSEEHLTCLAALDEAVLAGASEDGWAGLSRLVNEIELEETPSEEAVQTGDLLYLEKSTQVLPAGAKADGADRWHLAGGGTGQRIEGASAPTNGTGCMQLTLTPEAAREGQRAWMYQTITSEGEPSVFEQGQLYTVALWLRQENMTDREVLVWLSGRFESAGTVIGNVGNAWKKYTYTFLMPRAASGDAAGEIRLNIGLAGAGDLWADGVWFGPAEETPGAPDSGFAAEFEATAPAVVRLAFLGIGAPGSKAGSWAYTAGNEATVVQDAALSAYSSGSLDTALKLAEQGGALPWLTVDAYLSDGELRNLAEYLAGPITSEYGRMRMENGSVRPWTDVFPRIYLEIRDSGNLLGSDGLRASYVNHLIRTMEESPHYPILKNRLVFVDGMPYGDALMTSLADYHASSLAVPVRAGWEQSDIGNAFQDLFDASPRITNRPDDENYELIHTLNVRTESGLPADLATWADCLGTALTQGYDVVLAQPEGAAGPIETGAAAVRILSGRATGTPLRVAELDAANPAVSAYAFRDRAQQTVLLTSHSGQMVSLALEADFPLIPSVADTYDSTGRHVATTVLKHDSDAIDILPGGVTVLTIETDED